MSFIKLLIILVLIVAAVGGGYYFLEKNLELGQPGNAKVEDLALTEVNGMKWYQDKLKSFNMVVFQRPLEFVFTAENSQSLREQARAGNFILATNGSFYRGSNIKAEHSGLLQIKGKIIEPLVFDSQLQLTHVVLYDHSTSKMTFHPTQGFEPDDYSGERYSAMQTGPLIIENNEVRQDLIDSSINGKTRNLRTLLGYTNDGDIFIIVTRVTVRLDEIAEQILKLDNFSGKSLNVVNLDGGSSTSMYSDSLEAFNFFETKRLPVVIGVL